jgi:putative peptide zinc metalloprotease protein
VVAAGADGIRTCEEMAAVASVELDRRLTGADVRFLVRDKLAPAGILTTAGAAPSPLPEEPAAPARAAPATDGRLLGLRFRRAVVPSHRLNAWARRFAPLFRAPVVAGVLAAVAVIDLWLFGVHGVGGVLDQVVRTPAVMAFVATLVGISAVFHELGHAAGCRSSGGRPGAAGVGLYLCWPVLYANVTDAYRLDRRGRLRTDLGGIYFNAVFTVVVAMAYAATGYEPLLAVIVIEHVLVVHQLIPFARFDGFYVVSDLTGVPDILSRVKPALQSLIPGRPPHPAVAAMRPGARRMLFAYLGALIVFLALVVVPALLVIPRTLAANWDSIRPHLHEISEAAGQWDTPLVVVKALVVAVLALPSVGVALALGLLGARLVGGGAHLAGRARTAVRRRPSRAIAPAKARPRPTVVEERELTVRNWLESCGLAIVEGAELPGGGVVDYFGFSFEGELVLFGTAGDRPAPDVAAGLAAAAGVLGSFSFDKLDRLLLDGPPFAEAVATAARRAGCDWDERAFRTRLDATLARRDFDLVVLNTTHRAP